MTGQNQHALYKATKLPYTQCTELRLSTVRTRGVWVILEEYSMLMWNIVTYLRI